ncbi:MAG: hypothetical protein R3Y63_05260 [Eubacteriales bacterium]
MSLLNKLASGKTPNLQDLASAERTLKSRKNQAKRDIASLKKVVDAVKKK